VVGDTGFEPVTSSVSMRSPKDPTRIKMLRQLRAQSDDVRGDPRSDVPVGTQFGTHLVLSFCIRAASVVG